MAETNGTTRAIDLISIHDAAVAVLASEPHEDGRRTIWLSIPAPRVPGDQSRVVVYLNADALRKLRDDCATLLAQIEG